MEIAERECLNGESENVNWLCTVASGVDQGSLTGTLTRPKVASGDVPGVS